MSGFIKFVIRLNILYVNKVALKIVLFRIDSINFLPTGKLLTFQDVLMLIKSVVNKNKYKY